jgi:hypothetical protein
MDYICDVYDIYMERERERLHTGGYRCIERESARWRRSSCPATRDHNACAPRAATGRWARRSEGVEGHTDDRVCQTAKQK